MKRRSVAKVTQYNMDYETFKTTRFSTIKNQNMKADKERESLKIAQLKFEKLHDKVHHDINEEKDSTAGRLHKVKMKAVKSHEKQLQRTEDNLTQYLEYEEPIHFTLNSSPLIHSTKTYLKLDLDEFSIDDHVLSKQLNLKLLVL